MLALSCLLVLVPHADAGAQTGTTQSGDPQTPGGATGDGMPGPNEAGNLVLRRDTRIVEKPWSLSAGVNATTEDNVQLTADGSRDIGTRLDVGISRSAVLRRAAFSLGANVNQALYRDTTDLNRLGYDLMGQFTYAVTRRLQWVAGDTVSSSYAQDSRVLTDAGLVYPKVLTRTNTGSSSLGYAVSPTTQLSGAVSFQRLLFDSPDLVGQSNLSTTASLTHTINRTKTLGVGWEQSFSDVIIGSIQGVRATWTSAFGRGGSISISGGARAYTPEIGQDRQVSPAGSFAIGTRLGRSSSIQGHYDRSIEPTYGYNGVSASDRLGGALQFTVNRRVSLNGGADYGITSSPSSDAFRQEGTTVSSGAQFQLRDYLSASALYSLWIGRTGSQPQVIGQRVGVGVTYGVSWR